MDVKQEVDPCPGECCNKKCTNLRVRSKRSPYNWTTKCGACLAAARERSQRSYHKKSRVNREQAVIAGKLADRNLTLYEEKRRCAELRKKLLISEKRCSKLQESFEESQNALADALDVANGGKPTKPLPSGVSVRTESLVLHELQQLREGVQDLQIRKTGDLEEFVARLQAEHKESMGMFRANMLEMDRMLENLRKVNDGLNDVLEEMQRERAALQHQKQQQRRKVAKKRMNAN